jgi:exonuclease III
MEKRPWILCLQETKLQSCADGVCLSMWDGQPAMFSFRPSIGASGGLLTLWDSTEVEVWSSSSFDHVLSIHGHFISSNDEFHLFNVYAPCNGNDRQVLWDSLTVRLQALRGKNVCVCGDFNAVRCMEERRSVSTSGGVMDFEPFNNFIVENALCDLPLCGRNFTWFKGDGKSMSHIDRFLLSEDWCLVWPNSVQVAHLKGLSDHCPLILSVDEENWGPRPSRFLKCWSEIPGYKQFVRNTWSSFQVEGWGGYVLKEKFKLIKSALKDWHASHSQNLPAQIAVLKDRMAVLDGRGERDELSVDDCIELHDVSANLHSLSRLNSSICWQQSRNQWLREGDANTKYFHSMLSARRRRNAICSVLVDGVRIEGVHPVRSAVFNHFAKHFKAQDVERPNISNL